MPNDIRDLTDEQQAERLHRSWRTRCQGKEAFESRAIAEKVARRSGRSAYKCRSCGKWHVGTQEWTRSTKRKSGDR